MLSNSPIANRREDLRLITGRGRYSADLNLPAQLHACFLRSEHAHAQLKVVDAEPALARSGVVAVFTGVDAVAARYTQFPNMLTFIGRNVRDPAYEHFDQVAVGSGVGLGVGFLLGMTYSMLQVPDCGYGSGVVCW